ncbi:MAG: DUF1345 domain-containing protein [Sphingomonas sp.]
MISTLLAFARRRIAPPRFLMFCAVFAGALPVLVPLVGNGRGIMAAFDVASAAFLLSIAPLLSSETAGMRRRARDNDANTVLLLGLTGVVMIVILIAVASEMRAKSSPATIALVVGTLALAWLFSNTIYALHYAKLYYSNDASGSDRGGLTFPETTEPNYWDFAYFSFTLGMTFQTSDVEVTRTAIRQTVIGQSLAAFVFNIGVLAFSINVLGGG